MSVAIIGGLDRLKRSYERECQNRGFDARVFSQRIPNMARRMNGVQRILSDRSVRYFESNHDPQEDFDWPFCRIVQLFTEIARWRSVRHFRSREPRCIDT